MWITICWHGTGTAQRQRVGVATVLVLCRLTPLQNAVPLLYSSSYALPSFFFFFSPGVPLSSSFSLRAFLSLIFFSPQAFLSLFCFSPGPPLSPSISPRIIPIMNSVCMPACVLLQLRYTGMLETTRIRREGFAIRPSFEEFVSRFKSLANLQIRPDAKGLVLVHHVHTDFLD